MMGWESRRILAALQFMPPHGDPAAALERIGVLTRNLRCDLLVLPELCTTGYRFGSRETLFALAEPAGEGETGRFFRDLSASVGGVVVAGLAERDGPRLFNSAMVWTPDGRLAGLYRKLHLFNEEKALFSPGDEPAPIVEYEGMRMGLMICFDWAFPEVARGLALGGADVLAHPCNLVLPHAQRVAYARAVENGVYHVLANRIGAEGPEEDRTVFNGSSRIVGPGGDLVEAQGQEEVILCMEADLEQARNKWITRKNHLFLDRRKGIDGIACPV